MMRGFIAAILLLACSACSSDAEIAEINAVLDARDQAISRQDIGAYSALLIRDYSDRNQTKVTVVAHLIDIFEQFEATRMQSQHRRIRLLEDGRAECDQAYSLAVKAEGKWREIGGREHLTLSKTAAGWRISGGL